MIDTRSNRWSMGTFSMSSNACESQQINKQFRKALGELKPVPADAAGGLVSSGALALLHQILRTGVPR
jgi:hypothetical protein